MLPGLVQALHAQTHAVRRIVAVDTGSRDRSGAVLGELIGQDAVFGMDRATGFGQAAWGALRQVPALPPESSGQPQVEWVWLLHDDCEPAPEMLERLLRAASRDRSVVILGPKVLDGTDHRVLREAGVSIDRSGRRVTGIDPGEIDQGQHDHNRAVLAVGSAGMLIRRDAWEQLGGFDTHLRLFRDDVDFCWRAHSAGYRVQVVTDAHLYHRELTARRGRAPEGITARRLDRRNALYVLAVNLPVLSMLPTMAGCAAGTLLRAAYFLLTKQLDQATDQAHALGGIFLNPVLLWQARRRRAPGRNRGYDAVRSFIPPSRPLRQLSDHVMSLLSPQGTGGAHHAATAGDGGDGGGDDEVIAAPPSLTRRIVASPGVQLFTALAVVALVAERRLLGMSPLGGGALVPAWGGASALWSEYLAGFHAVGLGSSATALPYVAVVAALSTIFGGQAWLAVDVLLLGCAPLAGLAAYLASRRLVPARAARVWLAAAYALIPVASGAVAAGRLGTAAVLIIAPLIARTAARMLTAPPRQSRNAAWATGLLVALAAAFVPLAWILAAGLTLVTLVTGRWAWPPLARRWPGSPARAAVSPAPAASPAPPGPAGARPLSLASAAIVVLAPFLVLFPWSLHLLARPSAFLAEAGLARDGLASASLHPSHLLLLSPGGPGLPPFWVTAGLALAVLGTLLRRRPAVVLAGWSVAVAGYAAAIAVSRSAVPAVEGGTTSAWPGTELAIAALGLLIAAAPAAEWLASGLARRPERASAAGADSGPAGTGAGGQATRRAVPAPRALAIAGLAAVASAPLLGAWFWVTDGVRGPVTPVSSPVLPAFVAASSGGGQGYRTLVLRDDGGSLTYSVLRQGDPTLGEPELAESAPAEAALARQVEALGAAGGAGDPGLALGDFGIHWVLLPSPVDTALAQRLDAAVGLVQLSSAPAYDLWQVTGPSGRARVVGPGAAVTALAGLAGGKPVSAPASGGTLVLAEPQGGWTAKLNGRALAPAAQPADGWAQAFTLPPGGGQLAISQDSLARDASLIAELVAFLVICVLALPGKRADPAVAEAEVPAAVRELRPGSRAAQRAAGRRGARDSAPGRPEATATGGRRRPAGAHASGAHAVISPDPAFGPGADEAATLLNVTAAGSPADQPGLARDAAADATSAWADGGRSPDASGPYPVSGADAPRAGRSGRHRGGSGSGGRIDPEDARWADVLAARDSGAWPALLSDDSGDPAPPEAREARAQEDRAQALAAPATPAGQSSSSFDTQSWEAQLFEDQPYERPSGQASSWAASSPAASSPGPQPADPRFPPAPPAGGLLPQRSPLGDAQPEGPRPGEPATGDPQLARPESASATFGSPAFGDSRGDADAAGTTAPWSTLPADTLATGPVPWSTPGPGSPAPDATSPVVAPDPQAASTSSTAPSFDWLSASATSPAPAQPPRPARAVAGASAAGGPGHATGTEHDAAQPDRAPSTGHGNTAGATPPGRDTGASGPWPVQPAASGPGWAASPAGGESSGSLTVPAPGSYAGQPEGSASGSSGTRAVRPGSSPRPDRPAGSGPDAGLAGAARPVSGETAGQPSAAFSQDAEPSAVTASGPGDVRPPLPGNDPGADRLAGPGSDPDDGEAPRPVPGEVAGPVTASGTGPDGERPDVSASDSGGDQPVPPTGAGPAAGPSAPADPGSPAERGPGAGPPAAPGEGAGTERPAGPGLGWVPRPNRLPSAGSPSPAGTSPQPVRPGERESGSSGNRTAMPGGALRGSRPVSPGPGPTPTFTPHPPGSEPVGPQGERRAPDGSGPWPAMPGGRPGTGPTPTWTPRPPGRPATGAGWAGHDPAGGSASASSSGAWPAASGTGPTPVRPRATGTGPSPAWNGPGSSPSGGWPTQPPAGPPPAAGSGAFPGNGPGGQLPDGEQDPSDGDPGSPLASRQPWDPAPEAPREPADDQGADEQATGARPAGRHRGRHGRPARRPWDRSARDKGGES